MYLSSVSWWFQEVWWLSVRRISGTQGATGNVIPNMNEIYWNAAGIMAISPKERLPVSARHYFCCCTLADMLCTRRSWGMGGEGNEEERVLQCFLLFYCWYNFCLFVCSSGIGIVKLVLLSLCDVDPKGTLWTTMSYNWSQLKKAQQAALCPHSHASGINQYKWQRNPGLGKTVFWQEEKKTDENFRRQE